MGVWFCAPFVLGGMGINSLEEEENEQVDEAERKQTTPVFHDDDQEMLNLLEQIRVVYMHASYISKYSGAVCYWTVQIIKVVFFFKVSAGLTQLAIVRPKLES